MTGLHMPMPSGSTWPTHPDGRNKTVAEMTAGERDRFLGPLVAFVRAHLGDALVDDAEIEAGSDQRRPGSLRAASAPQPLDLSPKILNRIASMSDWHMRLSFEDAQDLRAWIVTAVDRLRAAQAVPDELRELQRAALVNLKWAADQDRFSDAEIRQCVRAWDFSGLTRHVPEGPRLRALAKIGARHKHADYLAHPGEHLVGESKQHIGLFTSCPHPDCVLVRTEALK